MKKLLLLFILSVLIISCQQKQAEEAVYGLADMEEEISPVTRQSLNAPPPVMDNIGTQEVVKKKIIKDGRMGLKVKELEKTKIRIDTLIKNYGGYYANERFNNTDWESSFNLQIRVPGANFEKLITDIETGDGEVQYKEVDARDVTEQFIDLETRLENKRNYLARYNDLLKQAKNVTEILEIEEKIRVLEEEIESTTGRLKYLSDLVDYSTLDLTLSKDKPFKYNPVSRSNFSESLKQSLWKGWFGFVDFLLFTIKIWPFWIVVALIFYGWRKFKQRKGEK